MDPPKTQQTTVAAPPKKPTSTLLDAYEMECIRRELESLLLNQNPGEARATISSSVHAAAEILGLPRRRRRSSKKTSSAKNANPAPPLPPPAKKLSGCGTRLHLGKNAVKICGGAVSVAISSAGANGRRPRRAGYREVEKV